MKLSALKVDSRTAEAGAWVDRIPDMGDLRLKVRGPMNADARRLRASLIDAVPRDQRPDGRPLPKTLDEIAAKVMAEAVLVDWAGLTADDGEAVPFSKESALALLLDPDYRPLLDAVAWASAKVGDSQATQHEANRGNS